MPLRKVIMSGGGTGGHIFPAVAIADALRQQHPDTDILFVGARGKMEMEKVPQAGYRITGLDITGFQRSLSFKNLMLPIRIIKSLLQARRILKTEKPDIVIGTGGFASAPVLYMATRMGIPALIQEQNSFPGKVNTFLGKRVQKICTAYPGLQNVFPAEKIILTGNPVRAQIEHSQIAKTDAAASFGFSSSSPLVLVCGGSLGALAINDGIYHAAEELNAKGIQVIWQTGKPYYEKARALVEENGYSHIKVTTFISNMEYAYAAADLVISRAGAIAISELSLLGKATVLVPLPTAAEDHQTKNAMALSQRQAAILLSNAEAPVKLGQTILNLLNQPAEIKQLELNIKKMALPGAAAKIASEAEKLVQ